MSSHISATGHPDVERSDVPLFRYSLEHASVNQDCANLLTNLGVSESAESGEYLLQHKMLAFQSSYKGSGGKRRIVFVYENLFKSWPGSQPETIVITDAQYRLLAWEEVGGTAMLRVTTLSSDKNGRPTLLFDKSHSDAHRIGRYTVSLDNDRIAQVGGVKWWTGRWAEGHYLYD
jgi:hypothetical protein